MLNNSQRQLLHIAVLNACVTATVFAQIPYVELEHVRIAPVLISACHQFGYAMSSVGTNGFAIGAPAGEAGAEDEGCVSVHDLAGTHVDGIGNPESDSEDPRFGSALARWGASHYLTGAPGFDSASNTDEGIVYFVPLNGSSVSSAIRNPETNPENLRFGASLASIEGSLIIVGAPGANDRSGRVYLLDNQGETQNKIENPSGKPDEEFGHCLEVISNSVIVVGSLRGESVHLFNTQGDLIRTIRSPSDNPVGFGSALTVIAGGRIVVGAPADDTIQPSGEGLGKVYIYDHDGRPLGEADRPASLPAEGNNDRFGISLGAFGAGEYFVVGAPFSDTREKVDAGSAHVFDLNGRHITSVQNPNVSRTEFGSHVAGLSSNQFGVTELRGVSGGRLGAKPTGLVHLYTMTVHEPDPYEPDDTPLQARHYPLGQPQNHTFHTPDDRDWIKFFVHSDFEYEIQIESLGRSSAAIANVYRQSVDGRLNRVFCGRGCKTSDPGFYQTPFADVAFSNAITGVYYVEIENNNTNAVGKNTEYQMKVSTIGNTTLLAVLAIDLLSPLGKDSPPGTVAQVGDTLYPFNSANVIVVPGLTPGPHTVTIFYPTNSFMPVQDPLLPGQQGNANNILYGIPRVIDVLADTANFAPFAFLPFVKANATLQDGFTGAWLPNATLAFEATSGALSGVVVGEYPPFTSYGALWRTDANGRFPTNVILPLADWTLHIGGATYVSNTVGEAVSGASAGQAVSLGALTIDPVDSNTNGISDSYELLTFGGPVDGGADPDGDGLDTRTEYKLGTQPTNAASLFAFNDDFTNGIVAAGFSVCWPVASGRTYALYVHQNLTDTNTILTYGPWTAAVGQACMQWVDPAFTNRDKRFYSVGAILP